MDTFITNTDRGQLNYDIDEQCRVVFTNEIAIQRTQIVEYLEFLRVTVNSDDMVKGLGFVCSFMEIDTGISYDIELPAKNATSKPLIRVKNWDGSLPEDLSQMFYETIGAKSLVFEH